ncbi:MAG: bifunctional phosphoribosylaminoimidazolecarboxamide formyltransferase/IMP cyclohydrolase, partial [Polyangiaceae bacterium]|nr:bifunctional phosphoribosylaminoimidazolecarboxamide formyltransferase/IMP cyclohydrolase [Polyangiaceae bacterium]
MATRALISVSDKTGLIPFARALAAKGVELLSTGGTLKALKDEKIPVVAVEDYTGSPEVMAGRVKTLHPRVHGGILMRGKVDDADLERIGGKVIDLVVVNLYPFEKTVQNPSAKLEEIIENIDIGGPSMIRSAAKNHARVTVVCDAADYEVVLSEINASGSTTAATRRRLAAKAFARTAAYDAAIAGTLSAIADDAKDDEAPKKDPYPLHLVLPFERVYGLRYGENPHQSGAFYRDRNATAGSVATAESLGTGGKELSFNNLVDVDAAFEAVREYTGPAAVVVKHTNPCGVAIAADLPTAYRNARAADEVSAFGGIVALNREVDADTAKLLAETFLECIVAPSFAPAALETLRAKKNLRLLATGVVPPSNEAGLVYKRIAGGIVVQQRDASGPAEVAAAKVVTKRAPTATELEALGFSWLVCKHVKSNAIVLGLADRTVGVGAGQMSRVESVRIACSKAGDKAKGA